jgi:CheY-like chemotaxis protein
MIKAECMRRISILIVDENKYLLDGLTMQLRTKLRNCMVVTAKNALEAVKKLGEGPIDLLLMDLGIAGMDVRALAREAKQCCPLVRLYVMTGDTNPASEERARSLGARECQLNRSASQELLNSLCTS